MIPDLEALAAPLIVAIAFTIAVVMFLRTQMGAREGGAGHETGDDNLVAPRNDSATQAANQHGATTDRQFAPNSDDDGAG